MDPKSEVIALAPLDAVAAQIAELAEKSVRHLIEAAMLVREARRRVEAGEAGNVTWYEWAPHHIKLSTTRLRELQRIAEAEDPEKEIERLRAVTRERVKEHRAKKAATVRAIEDKRKQLMAWARTASLDAVQRVLQYIANEDFEEDFLRLSPAVTDKAEITAAIGGAA